MEAKHKNLLIGTLLAVVFVMAVGYAAFAQSLTVTGTAEITSKWDVHMENGTAVGTSTMGTTPTGTVSVADGGTTATLTGTLQSPGDYITYTIPIKNAGTLDAVLNSLKVTGEDGNKAAMTVTGNSTTGTTTAVSADGNIKYTITSPGTATLVKTTGTANLVVKAEFVNKAEGQGTAYGSTAKVTIALGYVQK